MNPAGTNFLAYLALVGWFPLSIGLFAWLRPAQAVMVAYVGGAMFLPEVVRIDPPVLPPFDKQTIPAFGALIGALIWARPKLVAAKPFRGADRAAIVLFVSFVLTVFTNMDPLLGLINAGDAMTIWDMVAGGFKLLLLTWVPFFTARALLRSRRDVRMVLQFMTVAGLVYSLPGLVELRLGPTLHERVYGFMQHDILQTLRDGGYRPMAFMTHGLNMSRFMLGCLLCAVALARMGGRVLGFPAWMSAAYLGLVLVLFKSSGALVWALFFVPVVLLLSVTLQLRIAVALAALVFLYPALRATDVFPTEKLLELATEYVSADRASSLGDRFECEDLLLTKAVERPWFGWGSNSRNRVFDASGRDISTTDGEWVIIFGQMGTVGFLAYFAMYLLPVLAAYRDRRKIRSPEDSQMIAVLAVIVTVFTVDNLPNSAGTIPQFFLSGAVMGAVAGLAAEQRRRAKRRLRSLRTSSLDADNQETSPMGEVATSGGAP